MADSTPVVGVLFSLGHAETRFGEEIRIVGSHAALGRWDPHLSIPLSTDPVAYPRWATSQVVWMLATDAELEYKYLRDRRALGEGVVWEDRIENRRVLLPRAGSRPAVWLVMDNAWDFPGSQGVPKAVTRRPPEVSKAGKCSPEWTDSFCDVCYGPDSGEDYFTPSCRIYSVEPEPFAQILPRRDTLSKLSDDDGPIMARERSTLSVCVQANSFSAHECDDGSDVDSPPQMFREMSCCSLSLGIRSSSLLPLQSDAPACDDAQSAEHEEGSAGRAALGDPPADKTPHPCPKSRTFEDAYAVVGDSPLGEGSFGLVWGCRSCQGGRGGDEAVRAVKRIAMSKLLPRDVRNLFGHDGREGEIRMHEGLVHPHIIRLHEVFRETDTVSLVMECCRGGDLFDLIRLHRTGLPETATATVQRHLLRALVFLHERLIIHRDVKCENVLVLEKDVPAERNTFKLCDFGFAARLSSGTELVNTRMGSPDNVAPEIVRGEAYSTPVDCWAAGVIMYMTLSAKPPFWARTDMEVLRKVTAGEYCLSGGVWDGISKDAKDLIGRLMAFVPGARASAKEALAHAWLSA